jgi:hypothetical protein
MATKPENVNPFAKYVEQSGEVAQENPFAKFVTPSLDVEQLKAATKKYEEEVPFTQRITDPLKQGIASLSGMLPGLEVSSIQKEINAIREGKRGPRDPMTGEQLPFQPEEQENAIKMLQEQQKQAQAKVMSAQAESGQFQTRPAVAALSNVDSAREAFKAFQVDPLGVMSSVSLQSLPQIVPALILGAVTRNPTVGALAMGSTSFAGELSSGVSEYFQEQGVNIKDPIEVNKALNDPAMFTKAYEYALTRGSIIGAADTAAAGLASKLLVPKNVIKNQFAKEAVNIGVAQPVAQILSGAGGEAAAQIATEGEVTKPGQVLLEAAGEGPSSVLETAAFGGREALNRLKTTPTEAAPVPSAEPAPTVTPTEAPPAIITEEEFEADEGLTPVSLTPPPVIAEEPVAAVPAAAPPLTQKEKIANLMAKKPNDPIVEAEALKLANQIAQAGDNLIADSFKGRIENTGGFTEDSQLDFYRQKLLEAQQKAGTAGEKVKETFNIENYLPTSNKAELKRFKEFLPNAPEDVKATIEKSNQYLQQLTDKVNELGYKVLDVDPRAPAEVRELKSKISGIAGSTFSFAKNAEHIAKQNRFANPDKLAKIEQDLIKDFAEVDQILGAAPKTEEVVATPSVEAPEPVEVAMSKNKRLTNFLSKDKNELIKRVAEGNNISPEYAEKVYNAEKEYLENFARYGYAPNPDPDHESKFIAAQKKYDAFQNRLNAVINKTKNQAANLRADETPRTDYEKQASDDYSKVVDESYDGKKNDTDVLANQSLDRYIPFDKLVDIISNANDVLLAPEQLKMRFGVQKADDAQRVIEAVRKRKVKKPEVKTQAEINRARQAEKKAAAEAAKKATEKKKADEAEMDAQLEAAERGEEAVKVEKKPEIKTEKQPDLKAPKLNQEWAEFKSELTEKPSSLTSEVYDQYTRFKAGNFSVPTANFTGAEARKRTNEFNKQAKEIYDKAAREFLNRSISIKPPTKNQQKLQVPDNLLAVPPPITKAIKGKAETIDQQKKALLSIAAPKSDPRAAIKGVLVEPDKMVSTDGHRMAILLTNTNVPETVILDKDNKPIDSSYPAYDRVADQAKNAKLVAAVNATALGDYARGVNKAQKYVDNAKSPFMFRIDGENYVYDGQYVEDLANLFRQFGYNEFNVGLASEKNNMLVAKSQDGKLTQYLMDVRDDRNIYMPFEVSTGEPGYSRSDKEGKPADKPYYNDFTSNIDSAELIKRIQNDREETIKEYAQTRAASRRALKKIAKYGSDIPMQRNLNDLLEKEEILKSTLDATKPIRNSAADFMAKATDEMADKNLAPEVEAVIRQVYEKYPNILEGLRLSLRTRKAGGTDAGNFNPHARMVTLWKDSSGVDNPSTIRHELTHSLEQMMTPEARKAVVDAWARAFEIAIKRNTDKKSQEFFNKVFDFLDNPSKESFDAATNIMPSYDFYQYMNPSEYWAVNAEKLMAAKLGTPWARFVSAVKKLLEALKSVFGVNNTFTVHKEFDNIINGKLERTKGTRDMLIDYLLQGKIELDFLNSIEDVNDLLYKHSRPDAPRKPSPSVRDAFMGGYENTKETVKDVLTSPVIATNNMIGKADRALTYFRNKNIFFGYGLEEADRQRYGGQIRNAHQQAIASVAVVNALHSGNIATQVMTLGKLEFDPNIQMFVAKKSDKSMANVVREKAKLIDKLGFDTGNRVIQSYFEAKRSRSIVNEYLNREAAYEKAIEAGQKEEEARKDLANIEAAVEKVNMDDEAMADFIALEDKYPELKNMMENWTAVNQNMIDMMEFSGIISKQRAKSLRSIEDYVPWYRIMDDQEDIHSAPKGTRGLTNVAADKKFGPGKTERDIDDIVDNMIHNVLTITRNSARNYAANRIVMEYGERYKEGKNAGKLRVFPKDGSDADGVRFNIIANGRRIVVRIQDPLVAEAVIGMENIDIPMNGALAFMANTLRRSITTFPAFQVAQLFMDAPTAALVTGLKNPAAVWSGVFTSFIKNIFKDDPIVAKLRAAGIGGYQSSARTPEKEIQIDIGLIQGSWFSKAMKGLDRFGDASDYSQRRSVYLQTMKETGDEMLALFQANNVIDFKKRGSGQLAQLVTKQVAFMNAYAQAIDVLAKGLAGTGLKGIDRKKALARMATAGMLLASATLVYCFLVGDDEEYNKLDDQTKMRNIFIPGLNIRLPMHSGAAFFFKAIPELLYNAITKEGTKDEYDRKRLTRALSKAAADALLGPNVTPTGVKPVVEIALNRNFFTGGQVTPRGMEDLAAFRQYNQNTSELGKIISALTGTEKTRLLNPIEADHLVRGLTGTVGAAVMWGTNLLAGDRPTPQARENPLYGQFIMPDVPRGREDLYYDLKSKTDEAYKTYMDLQRKGRREEATDWFKENKKLIQVYGYTSSIEADLKRLNGEIRRLSDLPKEKMSPDAKRKRMTELQEIKGRMLKDVISMRKRAGFDE